MIHSVRYSFIYSLLSFFLLPECVFLCAYCHLSSFAFKQNAHETEWKAKHLASLYGTAHFSGSIKCLYSNQILSSLVYSGLTPAFTSSFSFGQSKGNEKPFEKKAIKQMMITTTHDDYPKYFDFFWCFMPSFMLALKCPFFFCTSIWTHFSSFH